MSRPKLVTERAENSYAVQFRDGGLRQFGAEPPRFTFHVRDSGELEWLFSSDPHSFARAFVEGRFEIEGDLCAALRSQYDRAPAGLCHRFRARIARARALRRRAEGVAPAAVHPSFDCHPARLDRICRTLRLRQGERFLDLGCSWGALVLHAAEKYGANAVGCTKDARQFEFAAAQAAARGLAGRALFRRAGCTEIGGTFDKIASVGVVECIGRRGLARYLHAAYRALEDRGLFLIEGMTGPAFMRSRRLFSGVEVVHLSDLVREAEVAGFAVLAVENRRADGIVHAQAWVHDLEDNREACLSQVTPESYRNSLLSAAARTLNFERGLLDLHDVLLARR